MKPIYSTNQQTHTDTHRYIDTHSTAYHDSKNFSTNLNSLAREIIFRKFTKVKQQMKRSHDSITAADGIDASQSRADGRSILGRKDDNLAPKLIWEKRMSQKYQRDYWYNLATRESSWEMPVSLYETREDHTLPHSDVKETVVEGMKLPFADKTDLAHGWVKRVSTKHGSDYWFNEKTLESSWYDPLKGQIMSAQGVSRTVVDEVRQRLNQERLEASVDDPTLPRVVASTQLGQLVQQLKSMVCDCTSNQDFKAIFKLPSDDTSLITRCFQEDQILKTRLKLKERGGKLVDLPSFWDVWKNNNAFRRSILTSSDPNEAKWDLQKTYGYKIATNFMPGYAKAIYEYFGAEMVLDPCSGWGDRMTGAASSPMVKNYVCFDPNKALRPGYADTMQLFGHSVIRLDDTSMYFDNGFRVNSLPFEVGCKSLLKDESFDLVFTSPPFFDYEMYSDNNPKYRDWINDFYKPLFIESCRCVKRGKHVAIHIGDTSAGNIESFLKEEVHKICDLKLVFKIGESVHALYTHAYEWEVLVICYYNRCCRVIACLLAVVDFLAHVVQYHIFIIIIIIRPDRNEVE